MVGNSAFLIRVATALADRAPNSISVRRSELGKRLVGRGGISRKLLELPAHRRQAATAGAGTDLEKRAKFDRLERATWDVCFLVLIFQVREEFVSFFVSFLMRAFITPIALIVSISLHASMDAHPVFFRPRPWSFAKPLDTYHK